MTRHRRGRGLLVLATVLALGAGACGDDGEPADDGATDGATGAATDGATEAPDLSGQSVTVTAVWTGTEQERIEEVLQGFEDATGADVTFESAGSADLVSFIGTRIEGGNPFDIGVLPNPGLLRDFAESGDLKEIEEFAGEAVDANFAGVWRELASHDGTLYGVYFKAANKSTFWYNVNAFNNAGAQPPADLDAFLQLEQLIADSGVTPLAIGGADAWVLTDWFENVYLRSAGADLYDQLTNHEIPWTDQSVKDALTELGQVFGAEEFINGGADGALQQSFEDSVAKVYANPTAPDAAMVYEGDFVAGVITGDTDANLGTDADFFDFPAVAGSEPSVVGGGDVAVLFTDNEAAQELISYLATPQAVESWVTQGGFTSSNTGVDTALYPDDITRRSAEALIAVEDNFRFDMSDLQPAEFGGTTGQGMFKGFQDFLANPDDVDGIAQALEEDAAKAFG